MHKIKNDYVGISAKRLLIGNFFSRNVTFDVIYDYLRKGITSHILQKVNRDNLDDSEHLIKNLKVLWKNKTLTINDMPNDVIDFVFFVIFHKKDLYYFNLSKANGYNKRDDRDS